jgi:amino acid adenylation domain-containing protein
MFTSPNNTSAALLNQEEVIDAEHRQRADDEPARQSSSSDLPVQRLVAAQAAIAPNAIAIVTQHETLTYKELDDRASKLAQRLRTLGVGRNVVVGLCLARSPAMVVGALGILKAGGAYLPLDPSYPPTRLDFQLKDAQVPVLVTGQCVNARLAQGNWKVIELTPGGELASSQQHFDHPQASEGDLQATDLAYVIYTSGSTGQPKGVEITHASLQNLVSWHQEAFAITAADRATQQASPAFDAAVWEVWPYLTAGASLHLPEDDTRSNPQELRDWLVEHAITIAFVPTPMAERLIQLEWAPTTTLRILLTGADRLRHYPPPMLPFVLVNNYGPTECAVVSTSGTISPDNNAMQPPSIGRPISNVQAYILDDNMHPLPPGTPGELYLGGACLARGYRNRPDLTAERFVPNPFGQTKESRLYRTGDKVCYLEDGQLAFLGRIDEQLKIRGYRIEPEEIAAALDRHLAVQASLVTGREDAHGEKELVAYVVPRDGAALTATVLREFLLTHLPDYMIPATFYRLDHLPLLASGKIDRTLSALAHADQLSEEAYAAPSTPIEEHMTSILAKLLNLEKVGVGDNFFLMGGNSLLGAQVIARVRDAFDVDLSLLTLFNHPTVAELSREVEQLLVEKLERMPEDEAERRAIQIQQPRSL